MSGKRGQRGFGYIRRLPSGRYQASYVGPDNKRHFAPSSFATKPAVERWFHHERRLIDDSEWTPPALRAKLDRSLAQGGHGQFFIVRFVDRLAGDPIRTISDEITDHFEGSFPVESIAFYESEGHDV